MKRLFFIPLVIILLSPAVFAHHTPDHILDADNSREPKTFQFENPLEGINSFTQLADSIVDFLLTIAIPIVVIMVIWAGLLFMTAGGNKERVQQGRDTLFWAAIGVGVLMISKSVTYLLINILGG